MIVPYRIRVELIGVNTTFGVYIGRSIDEPLPADFIGNPKYIIGEIMTLIVPINAFEYSSSMDAARGDHYIIVGIQPQKAFGLAFPAAFTAKYIIEISGQQRTVEVDVTENMFAQVTFRVGDAGVTIVNYGKIAPGQPAIENPAQSSKLPDITAAAINSVGAVFGQMMQIMMPMMMFMMMMQMMMSMMQTLPAAMAGVM